MNGRRFSRFEKAVYLAVAVIGVLFGVYWYLWAREMEVYKLRSKVTEWVAAATACRTVVAEYYAARSRMPASAADAGCRFGIPKDTGGRVDNGVITLDAGGDLAIRLATNDSGIRLRLSPVCEGGPCLGQPITAWKCTSAIATRYLPPMCR